MFDVTYCIVGVPVNFYDFLGQYLTQVLDLFLNG